MTEEMCPKCHELIEHGSIHRDGTPIHPGNSRLDPRPRARVCMECRGYKPCDDDDQEDNPAPAGFYADLYRWRTEQRFQEEEGYE